MKPIQLTRRRNEVRPMNDKPNAKRPRKRWKRILMWTVAIILVALLVLFEVAYWTSTNDCGHTAAPTNPMKAIVYCDYGVANLKLEEIEKPVPNDDQILVRVRAASVNPYDWHFVEGTPYVMRAMGVGLAQTKGHTTGCRFCRNGGSRRQKRYPIQTRR